MVHSKEYELSNIYGNLDNLSVSSDIIKSSSNEDNKVTSSGGKVYRVVAVALGLLCLLLAGLIVYLFVAHCTNELEKELAASETQAKMKSLSEEKDELQRTLNVLGQGNWIISSGSAYYVSTTEDSWEAARRDCQNRQADLMVINNLGEQKFANQLNEYMWIGLTDLEVEGTWRWVDTTLMMT
ncbi:CD209 antigen-like protein 2, partial [Oryzias melastigma]